MEVFKGLQFVVEASGDAAKAVARVVQAKRTIGLLVAESVLGAMWADAPALEELASVLPPFEAGDDAMEYLTEVVPWRDALKLVFVETRV